MADRPLYRNTWKLIGHLESALSDAWDANLLAKRDKTMLVLRLLPDEAADLTSDARLHYLSQPKVIAKFEELERLTNQVSEWGLNYTGSTEERKLRFELRSRAKSLLQALENY